MTGWTCAQCDQPLDAHHDWHGCQFPEPGQVCLSGLHAVVIYGTDADPEHRVLHPAGCTDTCPVLYDLENAGLDGLHPDYPRGTWSPGWTPGRGVYLVQHWAVAGTTSPFALAPMDWDAGLTVHARLLFTSDTDAATLAVANLEGHPWT